MSIWKDVIYINNDQGEPSDVCHIFVEISTRGHFQTLCGYWITPDDLAFQKKRPLKQQVEDMCPICKEKDNRPR